MNKAFCEVTISCVNLKEADYIADHLLKNKFVACTEISPFIARYWWRGKIVGEERYRIISFSQLALKDKIIRAVKKLHSDEVPGIVFTAIEANEDFLKWIKESTRKA